MKKKTLLLIISLALLGIILIAMAPVWSKVILPELSKADTSMDLTMEFEGTLLLNIDPKSFKLYGQNQQMSIPITLQWTLETVPEKSSSDIVVIDEEVLVKSNTGQTLATINHVYDMDRKTGQNVNGKSSDQDRKGYLMPIGLEPGVFESWDNETSNTIRLQFVTEETRDGDTYKGVKTYVYDITVDSEKIIVPPLGYPLEITGSMFKTLLSNPGLPLSDDQAISLTYYTTISSRTAFEPTTGLMVDTPVYNRTYYVDAALPGEPLNLIQVASLDYSRTEDSVKEMVDLSAKYASAFNFAKRWVPVIFMISGIFVLIIAFFVLLRNFGKRKIPKKKRRKLIKPDKVKELNSEPPKDENSAADASGEPAEQPPPKDS
ncbi:MAG: DUF3068 domain-containing protein [Actinobacteria bacterium]|nr:DUF3068 domain-containing protein [Actinomycetota bacterium]